MIFVTGDTHGNVSRFDLASFPAQAEMTKEDYVVICGDFGLVWSEEESPYEKQWLDWLEEKPFTTLFLDGNHENHDRLDATPVSEWHGGRVHVVRPSVIHLMRGEYYTDVSGKSVFAFGGAVSHDIWNLLDPNEEDFLPRKRELDWTGQFYRIVGKTWWAREMPSMSEMENGKRNLAAHGNRVDFIFSHEMPLSDLLLYNPAYSRDPGENAFVLRRYLEEIRAATEYERWYCGHHHNNKQITCQDILIYEQIIRIA